METREHEPAQAWAQYAFGRLETAGFRRGGARSAVVELVGEQRCALSAVEIERALAAADRSAARASVYRVLEELESLGLLTRIELGDGVARYEARHPDGANHHHHLVCSDCGRLVPFHDEELERSIRRLSRRTRFTVDEHDLLLRGRCRACSDA